MIEETIAQRLTPSPDERKRLDDAVSALERRCNKALQDARIEGRATVQGSAAKDTWIAGSTDLDLFLLLDPATPPERLDEITSTVAAGTVEDPRRKYAQHPYLVGTFQGFQVDLVPAYAVDEASARMSAVDRTPFHTEWVRENLDSAGRSAVRVLKQWCKGTGVYGAETAIAGFSGYLLEVLVARFASFAGVLRWLAVGNPTRIALGEDHVEDEVSPLIVVDPVDPARNCAAAINEDTLARARHAATCYLEAPAEAFFFPAPPRAEPPSVLREGQQARQETWIGIRLTAQTDRLDIVLPQFQKAARAYASELERLGFPVHRQRVEVADAEILMQFVTADVQLPATRPHQGPAVAAAPNAERFCKKWDGHADAAGPVQEVDGHLQVAVHVQERRPLEALRGAVGRIHVGKHVKKALPEDPVIAAPERVDDTFGPAVADLVLDRYPWER